MPADGTHYEIDVLADNMLSWLYNNGYNSQQTLRIIDASRLIDGITEARGRSRARAEPRL